jgi:HEAT repeat protein
MAIPVTIASVAIRASSSKQIATLVADLSGGDATARDAAIARLTVIGTRAVERVIELATGAATATARGAALRTLEGIGDPRALPVALDALADREDSVAIAAAGVAHVFVRGAKGALAVDRLTAVALDGGRRPPVRIAALRALRDLGPITVAPLLKALSTDADARIAAEASSTAGGAGGGGDQDPVDLLTHAAEDELPADAQALRHALAQAGSTVALPVVLRIIERVRELEASEPVARRAEWTAVRAAGHLALAQRGSRLAVYDLRESIEAARAPLPVEFLAALSTIGDASCVEAIAGAFARARDQWWRDHLVDVFRAIVKRDKLTRRHAAIRKIEKKSKPALDALWPT